MEVETYEVEGTATRHPEVAGEAAKLIDELGLVGQLELMDGDGEHQLPYRRMTLEERVVYEELLPEKTTIESYKSGAIPLRVLQVAAHADSCGLFDRLDIWHPQEDFDDPLLVGVEGGNSWDAKHWILARWGNVLLPFADLRKMAGEALRVKLKAKFVSIQKGVESDMATIDAIDDPAAFVTLKTKRQGVHYHGLPDSGAW